MWIWEAYLFCYNMEATFSMALFVCAGAAARRALNGDWLPERAFGIDILRPDSCTLVGKAMAHHRISSESVLFSHRLASPILQR